MKWDGRLWDGEMRWDGRLWNEMVDCEMVNFEMRWWIGERNWKRENEREKSRTKIIKIKSQSQISLFTCCNKVDFDGVEISSKNKNSSSINSSIFSSSFNTDKEEDGGGWFSLFCCCFLVDVVGWFSEIVDFNKEDSINIKIIKK